MTFWIGMLIGACGGATFGALIMATMASVKRADDEIQREAVSRKLADNSGYRFAEVRVVADAPKVAPTYAFASTRHSDPPSTWWPG